MTTQATPAALTTHVLDAVSHGDWTPTEVTRTVTGEIRTNRSDVVATLWDLVESGDLATLDCHGELAFQLAG